MRRKPKQCEEALTLRRKLTRKIVPESTAKEKEAYITERDKHEVFDKKQKDPGRVTDTWRKFAKEKGIKPENLIIGTVPNEGELDLKSDVWLKKVIAEMEGHEPITDVNKNDDGTVTLTINPKVPRDLIFHELNKILPPPSKERFNRGKYQNCLQ